MGWKVINIPYQENINKEYLCKEIYYLNDDGVCAVNAVIPRDSVL